MSAFLSTDLFRLAELWWDWMFTMMWQVALLVAALGVLTWLLRRRSARLCYALWLLVPLRLVLPPTLAFVTGWGWWLMPASRPRAEVQPAPIVGEVPTQLTFEGNSRTKDLPLQDADEFLVEPRGGAPSTFVSLEPQLVTASQTSIGLGNRASWRLWLFLGWSVVACALLLRLLVGAIRVGRLVDAAQKVEDGPLRERVDAWSRKLGLRRPVGLRLAQCPVPMVLGIRRPTILLPTHVPERLDAGELEAVLVHELNHVARHDPSVSLLQAVLGSLYFFHPLVWFAQWRLHALREEACDEATVAALDGHRGAYGSGIVKVAERVDGRPPRLALGVVESGLSLKGRLQRILDPQLPVGRRLGWRALLFLGLVAALLLPAAARQVASTESRETPPPQASTPKPEDGRLTVTGRVLMPDGTPAAGALVTSIPDDRALPTTTRADADGWFQLDGWFRDHCRLHARSVDARNQTTMHETSFNARATFAKPVELTLKPARAYGVSVVSHSSDPVAGAHVAAMGVGDVYKVTGITGEDGTAELWLPETERLDELVAWHPRLGVAGKRSLVEDSPQASSQLALLEPGSHTIRVVDTEGKPVSNQDLAVNIRPEESDWIVLRVIEASHLRTGADGTVTAPWFPQESLEHVDVDFLGEDWKIDERDESELSRGLTTVRVRRRIAVEGRLVLPEGVSGEGILIEGTGFGPTNRGDGPVARVRRDGSFTLRVCSNHGYAVGVGDPEWAADVWTGKILSNDDSVPAEITLEAYAATPLSVRVTRGEPPTAVPDAWVHLSSPRSFEWREADGKERPCYGGVRAWLRTDAEGMARTGVGRGETHLRLAHPDWNEERSIEVTSKEPITVEFHRAWQGKRNLSVRLTRDGAAYHPSATARARVRAPQDPLQATVLEPEIREDGTLAFALDAGELSVLITDPERRLSGYVRIGPEDSAVELPMTPMAVYAGALVDEERGPVAHHALRLHVAGSRDLNLGDQTTDEQGRFRFDPVPAQVPVQLYVEREREGKTYFGSAGGKRFLLPGEVRDAARVRVRLGNPDSRAARRRQEPLLDQRLADALANARVSGMRVLVVLEGDPSDETDKFVRRVTDYDEVREVLGYQVLTVSSETLGDESSTLREHGWEPPGAGEVVLVALDGTGQQLDASAFGVTELASAWDVAAGFIRRHHPPVGDAKALLASAQASAARSGRCVWIVEGGPRCSPCFGLARWMKEHKALLEKDYVIVKILQGRDTHARDVMQSIRSENSSSSIPWMAIVEPDGTVLATSDGPLGNIGFPSSLEGVRHFRSMIEATRKRLTSEELDRLAESLATRRK